jgi:hypothetical protein
MVKDRKTEVHVEHSEIFFFSELPLGVNCAKKNVALCTLKIVPHQLK